MTNIELVRFAESKIGTAYVYGMKGTVMTEKQYTDLKRATVVWYGTVTGEKSVKFAWTVPA